MPQRKRPRLFDRRASRWQTADQSVEVVRRDEFAAGLLCQSRHQFFVDCDIAKLIRCAITDPSRFNCGNLLSVAVFDRRFDDQVLRLGVSGLLRNSDLVMYDRQTESWWQQFTGTAIVGDYTHATLTRIPSSIISFQSFATSHPEGQVLNRETSAIRPYGNNPYPGYDDINSSPFLLSDPTDPRLPPMERVIGVQVGGQIDGQHKIYPFSLFDNTSIIQDEILDTKLLIFRAGDLLSALDQRTIAESKVVAEVVAWDRTLKDTNQTLNFHLESGVLVDKETNSRWSISGKAISGPLAGQQLAAVDSGIHFSFAWLAFNPDTLIHSMDE